MILGKLLVVISVPVETTILGKLFLAKLLLAVGTARGNLWGAIFLIR
jgi:hypothetical protein